MSQKETHERQEGIRVYELGFHFVPTLSEDEVVVQFSHLKSLIEKKGGTFISEEIPQMIKLAYEISKTVKAQKKRYTSAYFGWVKFDIDPSELASIEKDVKAFEPILRYILITTVRENTLVVDKEAVVGATSPSKKAETKENGSETAVESTDETVQAE
jgi:ribosomal protein S6